MEIRVGGKYKITKKLGQGAYGELYSGVNLKTNDDVAIKLEKLDCRDPQLQYESKIYEKLAGQQGIPQVYWFGVEGDFNVMVLDILGPPLADLFSFCEYKFSMKTILWIAAQLISRIESLHSKNFIHRDCKPENFLIGSGKKSNMVYMIDFGLSKRFKCPKSGQHIQQKAKSFTGTPRWASLSAHQGYEQSRRDDLESLGYILIFFSKEGWLPWVKCENEKNSKHKQIALKDCVSMETLCSGLPPCFQEYMEYSRNLAFEQKPDYKYIKSLFETTFIEMGYKLDYEFCWHSKKLEILDKKLIQEKFEREKLDDLQQIKDMKKSKSKSVSKRDLLLQEQKKAFELKEEEKKRAIIEKKQKKKEKMALLEEESRSKIVENALLEKIVRDKQIEDKIMKVCREIEQSAQPKRREYMDDSIDSDYALNEDSKIVASPEQKGKKQGGQVIESEEEEKKQKE